MSLRRFAAFGAAVVVALTLHTCANLSTSRGTMSAASTYATDLSFRADQSAHVTDDKMQELGQRLARVRSGVDKLNTAAASSLADEVAASSAASISGSRHAATSLPPPPPPPVASPPGKPCPAGCEARGTCNKLNGECVCPPMVGGLSCELSIVPSCRQQWNLRLPIPPCQDMATEPEAWRNFPASCECLAECQNLNHRLAYVDKCVNSTGMRLLPMYTPARALRPPHVIDIQGEGRWMRQAYTPDRKAAPIEEDELRRLNLALAAKLEADGLQSARHGYCSGRGLYTDAMPYAHTRPYMPIHAHTCPYMHTHASIQTQTQTQT